MYYPGERFLGYVDRSCVRGEQFVGSILLSHVQQVAKDLKIPSPKITTGPVEDAQSVVLSYLPCVSLQWEFAESSHCITVAYDMQNSKVFVHCDGGAVRTLRGNNRFGEISSQGDFWKGYLSDKISVIYKGIQNNPNQ